MSSTKTKIGGFFIFLLLLVMVIMNSIELYHGVSFSINNYRSYLWMFVGIAVFTLWALIFKRNRTFLQVLGHEGAHIIVGLLFFHKIESLNASAGGNGKVIHRGKQNMFISLAPYCATYLTYFLLLIRLIIISKYLYLVDFFIGLTLAFHISCFLKDTRTYQPDLQVFGVAKSFLFILTFLFFNLTITLYAIRLNLWHSFSTYFTTLATDTGRLFLQLKDIIIA